MHSVKQWHSRPVLTVVLIALGLLLACEDSSIPAGPAEPSAPTGLDDPSHQGAGVGFSSVSASVGGQWAAPIPWPIVAVHLHLLPDGRVLSWGRHGTPQIWDPNTGTFQATASPSLVFCAGHDFLPDGRLFIAGGHVTQNGIGVPNVNVFDYRTSSWTALPRMAWGRWYPTAITLADGEVLILAGTDSSGTVVRTPELWTGSGWRRLEYAVQALHYYPRAFVVPDGNVFYAGEAPNTRWLELAGTPHWVNGPRTRFGQLRDYGAAVMYETGRILLVGGGDPPTATAETIDLNIRPPSWRFTGSMSVARRQLNATVLPDGTVLVTGGTSAPGFNTPSGAVLTAELWNPNTGSWTTVASNAVPRIYHSTTLLLPDGRVLDTGSGDTDPPAVDQRNAEIYSPPYLFKGPRPRITAAPGSITYGQRFYVGTPDAAGVTRVRLIRLGSTTHAFNAGQRLVTVLFSTTSGGLTVTAPASGAIAPPGFYMLFLVNGIGVPSVSRILNLQ